jgi:hypothetical protein
MFTMVASRTTISWASAMNTSAFQRLASGSLAGAPRVFEAVSDMGIPTSGLRDGKKVTKGNGSPAGTAVGTVAWSFRRRSSSDVREGLN